MQSPMEPPTTPNLVRKKAVHIAIVFIADNDDEALAIKKKVNMALTDHPDIQINFAIQDRPMPMS